MVGATDGATGDGGAVKVATHGIIQTSGAGSTGLIVQSIGGGGGAAVAVDADGLVREPIVEQANAAPAPRTMLRSFAAASVPQGAGSGGAVDVTIGAAIHTTGDQANGVRSEEHTSEIQSLMRNSYADFCLKKKKIINQYQNIKKHKRCVTKKYTCKTKVTVSITTKNTVQSLSSYVLECNQYQLEQTQYNI